MASACPICGKTLDVFDNCTNCGRHFPREEQPSPTITVPRWEYRVLSINSTTENVQKQLNLYGAQGWELVHVEGFEYFFKRRKG